MCTNLEIIVENCKGSSMFFKKKLYLCLIGLKLIIIA